MRRYNASAEEVNSKGLLGTRILESVWGWGITPWFECKWAVVIIASVVMKVSCTDANVGSEQKHSNGKGYHGDANMCEGLIKKGKPICGARENRSLQ